MFIAELQELYLMSEIWKIRFSTRFCVLQFLQLAKQGGAAGKWLFMQFGILKLKCNFLPYTLKIINFAQLLKKNKQKARIKWN